MNKIKLVFTVITAFLALSSMAQQNPMWTSEGAQPNRDASYECPEGSVFSQLPSLLDAGWFCDEGSTWTRAADDYTASAPFASMRCWGANISASPGTSQTYVVRFYERNTGNPFIPGTEVKTFTLTIVPQPINLLFGIDYQVDFEFPETVDLLDGWVSLTRQNPGDGADFVWLGNQMGNSGNSVSYSGSWTDSYGELAFCLGAAEEVPLSNVAIVIGIVLIALFAVLRYRRIF